jgi:Zn-dependent protease with chaperone function
VHWAVYLLPLLVPAVAALAARPLSDRLPPCAATWLLAGSALALAASSSMVLGLLALNALFRVPFVASLAHMSARVIRAASPASMPVAIIAGALLAITAFTASRALLHRLGAIAAAGRQARDLPGAGQVVVTEDEAADAYTLPGWPCRIVVTSGMLRALTEPERRVLLAHERTHAAWAHYLFTAAARLAAAANPLLRPVATAIGYTVERWADERAAAATGDRALAAKAIARAALAAKAAPPGSRETARRGPGRAGLGTALGLVTLPWNAARGAGPVPRRVAALLLPPPRLSLLLVAGAVLLVALSGISALEAARSMHQFVEYAQGSGAS